VLISASLLIVFTRPPQTTTTTQTTTSTITTTVALPCDLPVWNSSQTSNEVPVLLMQPSSTGHICVTYQSAWKGNSSEYQKHYAGFQNIQFGLSISKEHCVATPGGGTSCAPVDFNSFVTSAVPSSIQLSGTTDYVTVVYTVISLSNSTGFYDNSAPYLASCRTMPMAVGYAASQVNASDFATIFVPPCSLQAFSPSSVSIAGMNFTYVQFP
jgi:hypothetical protein